MKTNDGGPAFPESDTIGGPGGPGMSFRAYVASKVLSSLVATGQKIDRGDGQSADSPQERANVAVVYADALIAELAKEPKK